MSDIECPYCGHGQEVCHDDGANYDESETHQMECHQCERTFVFTTCISFDYSPEKADCLNEGDHNWKPTHTFPKQYTKMRCSMCDEDRECTADEMREVCVGDLKAEARGENK